MPWDAMGWPLDDDRFRRRPSFSPTARTQRVMRELPPTRDPVMSALGEGWGQARRAGVSRDIGSLKPAGRISVQPIRRERVT